MSRWVPFAGLKSWVFACIAAVMVMAAGGADARQPVRKPAVKAQAAKKPVVKAVKGRKSTLAVRGKKSAKSRMAARQPVVPAAPSVGQLAGLHAGGDPLDLKSAVALVIDQETNQVLFSKNADAVLPIASLTKLMTALVIVESHQALDELVSVDQEDLDLTANNRSRLASGTVLPRSEMLQLALMSSENRAASALSRHYPGGMPAFVAAMNSRAASLGMHDTHYVEPTGLSSDNRSSARVLVRAGACRIGAQVDS